MVNSEKKEKEDSVAQLEVLSQNAPGSNKKTLVRIAESTGEIQAGFLPNNKDRIFSKFVYSLFFFFFFYFLILIPNIIRHGSAEGYIHDYIK